MTWVILTLVVVALLVVAAVVIEQQRSASLKRRFGPEYDRVVEELGDRKGAEAALRERIKRRKSIQLHDLPAAAVERYRAQFHKVQTAFVDDPGGSVAGARNLVDEVIADRGYHEAVAADGDGSGGVPEPVELVAIDHPHLVANYRTARTGGAAASLDDLRATFIHYRELFEAILADGTAREVDLTVDGDGQRDEAVRSGVTR
jgi:hypothetical protein